MLEALERHFPAQAEWTRPEGGLFVWATLPDYIDTTDLLAKALRENVAFVPGRAAYVDGRGGVRDAAQLLGPRPRTRSARASGGSARSFRTRSALRDDHREKAPRRARLEEAAEPKGDVAPTPRRWEERG